jgi:hypothetical protein
MSFCFLSFSTLDSLSLALVISLLFCPLSISLGLVRTKRKGEAIREIGEMREVSRFASVLVWRETRETKKKKTLKIIFK